MSSTEEHSKLAMAKTVVTTIGSVAAAAMVVRSVTHDYLPPEIQDFLFSGIRTFFNRFSSQLTMVIDEFDGLVNNEIYDAAEVYLASKISYDTNRLKVSKPDKEKSINIAMDSNEEVTDEFDGAKLKWVFVTTQVESKSFYNPRDTNSTLRSELRSFQLTFHKKHKDKVLNSYLPFILKEAKSMHHEKKTLKIFTVDHENMYMGLSNAWIPVNLDHPATFDTLAMDSEMKDTLMKDLERFVRRREYYRKVGKAWKRGYLLYGPPGTGKSSLIAAMANYLNFDIYDLELTELRCNSELRRLLLATANQSILVVEDIDCTIELQDRDVAEASQIHAAHNQQQNKSCFWSLSMVLKGLVAEKINILNSEHPSFGCINMGSVAENDNTVKYTIKGLPF
ncbi:protein HYPER-SENSITIVITY-RELATED 4-like isoform X2 [Cornus florida]|uniref:protein HYPER-SENSITIVITY-RELATED 4-like isoform X2 n=1 Tax=Cornus florida TaxID=4283 RepID=UPI00289EB221|nr:protein HYPER-SENSITIVITY-RELATED 4-like isoform X2 [Cornus florida]